jgi:diguanylate cyclase (GGDEF)-like protein/PAS domain S-box-containing protein
VTARDITERRHAEEQLQERNLDLKLAQRIAHIGSWVFDPEIGTPQWSDVVYQLYARDPDLGPPSLDEYKQLYSGEHLQHFWNAIQAALHSGTPYDIELQLQLPSGATKWVHALCESSPDKGPKGHRLRGTIQDITERKQAERQMRLAACVFAHSLHGVVVADPAMHILDANRSYCELTGFSKNELLGQPLARVVAGGDGRSLPETLRASLDATGSCQTEISARRKDDAPFPAMLSLNRVRDADGTPQNYIASVADITALKAHEAELERLAHHDALTGLPNRRLLLDRLAQAIALTDRTGGSLAVCYLDLDGFKPINDRHGHEAGDQYLIQVAELLQANLRGQDSVARIGGDEFVLMLTELQCPEGDCCAQLDRILAAIHEPVTLNGVRHQVAASIGVTFYPGDRSGPEVLLDHADQVMYRAKQSGGRCYRIYQAERH